MLFGLNCPPFSWATGFLRTYYRAYAGSWAARTAHRRHLAQPAILERGIAAIAHRWPGVRSHSAASPVFILSAGWRSGSTFLQRLVLSSGSVMIWGEPYGHAELVDSIAGPIRCFTDEWPRTDWYVDERSIDRVEDLSKLWVANLYPPLPDLIESHLAFFDRLFGWPAREKGVDRWGLKEVRLTLDHAHYLRWLYPNAKFLFLYRNPYDAYRSYRNWGAAWYDRWPSKPVFTAAQFGRHWLYLTKDFIKGHQAVGGMLIRYEELCTSGQLANEVAAYLGVVAPEVRSLGNVGSRREHGFEVPRVELKLLENAVKPLAANLGYIRPRRSV